MVVTVDRLEVSRLEVSLTDASLGAILCQPEKRQAMRGGAVAARRAHNPEVAGSSPAPARKNQAPNREPFLLHWSITGHRRLIISLDSPA